MKHGLQQRIRASGTTVKARKKNAIWPGGSETERKKRRLGDAKLNRGIASFHAGI